MINEYNDNELLYYISENDEFAFEKLLEKYKPMILNKLKAFRIKYEYWDDFYQECTMVLYECALRYREDIMHTFNKYLDISLQFRIRNLLRKEKKYFYDVSLMPIDSIEAIAMERLEEESVFETQDSKESKNEVLIKLEAGESIKMIADSRGENYYRVYRMVNKLRNSYGSLYVRKSDSKFSFLEKEVYSRYINGYKPLEIAREMELDIDSVYNAIKRVKRKIKKNMNKTD